VPVAERKQSQADLINKTRGIVKKYQSKDYRVNVSGSSSIGNSLGLGRGGSGIGYYIAWTGHSKTRRIFESVG
jgi:hypothetical protein